MNVLLPGVHTMLIWINEHLSGYKLARKSDSETVASSTFSKTPRPKDASTCGGLWNSWMAGYTIDPLKRLPRGRTDGMNRT